MITKQYIILGCWLIFMLYWGISTKSVKPAQETKRKFSGLWLNAGRIFLVSLFLASFANFPIYPFTVSLLPTIGALKITGVILAVLGVVIAILARKTLADNWSHNIDLKKDHELITTGIYSYVRNPIYTGILLMSLGTLLFTGRFSSLIFFLFMLAFLLFKLKEEEELLAAHFTVEYSEYKKRTKALIPFLW